MRKIRLIRVVPTLVVGLSPILCIDRALAQAEPSTIPTVVAQAMAFEPSYLGRPQFFNGQAPPDWPTALVPPGAKVLGSGVLGNEGIYRMRATVFEFTPGFSLRDVFQPLLARAGYAQPSAQAVHPRDGGFVETAAPVSPGAPFCSGSAAATFGLGDSVRAPNVAAPYLIDGEAARQMCAPNQTALASHRFPVSVPPLVAPPGTIWAGGGSNWSGSGGDMTSSLHTTMPTDSVLAHYSAQLVAGGWKREGRPALGDGISVQRFSFREGQDAWTGALIVLAAGDRRDIVLRVSKRE